MLFTDYLFLLLIILASIVLFIGMRSKRRWLVISCYGIAILVFVLYVLDMKTAWFDYLWIWIIPHPSTIILQIAAVWGACIAVLLSLGGYLPELRKRRAVYIIAILTAGWGIYVIAKQLVVPPVSQNTWWNGDVLMQSTSSTCIAAAACTYLKTKGVDLDEKQAVKRGVISVEGGTMSNAWRILKLSLPTADVHIAPLGLADLTPDKWYVTSIRYSVLEGHAVVVKSLADGQTILIRDPLKGESSVSLNQFNKQWLHDCVWIED